MTLGKISLHCILKFLLIIRSTHIPFSWNSTNPITFTLLYKKSWIYCYWKTRSCSMYPLKTETKSGKQRYYIILDIKCLIWMLKTDRSSRPEVFCNKGVVRNFAKFTGKHLRQSLFFNKVCFFINFIKKETLAQSFSCEICEISKNTFYYRTPLVAASE